MHFTDFQRITMYVAQGACHRMFEFGPRAGVSLGSQSPEIKFYSQYH